MAAGNWNKSLDSIRAINYALRFKIFPEILKPQGVFVSKIFSVKTVKNLAKSIFKEVSFFKPESSRNESRETYIHCKILKSL